MTKPMDVAGVQSLLIALLDLARAIANDSDDPMCDVLASARAIDSALPERDSAVMITSADGRRIRIDISPTA